ncbi:MAG: hypothetical protein ABJB16_08915 [Saprospiraceae bacterium]
MKDLTTFFFFFFFFFLSCTLQLTAQPNHKDHPKKWQLSFSADKSFEAPGKNIAKAMQSSGFGDLTPLVYHASYIEYINIAESNFVPAHTTGGLRYPIRNGIKNNLSVQVRYNLNHHIALEVKFGNHWSESIQGYDAYLEEGNFLTLSTEGKILSASYMQLIGNRGSGLSIGPVLAFHRVLASANGRGNKYLHHTVQPGIHTGCDISLLKSKTFYAGLNPQYNWFPQDEIESITIEKLLTDDHQNQILFTSVFRKTRIQLSNFNFYITAGIKF